MSFARSIEARGRRSLAFLLLMVLGLVACAPAALPPADSSATPRPPVALTTTPVLAARATLPPTWTPTHTPTPLPPSPTPTATLTPSITPTRSDADRCAAFTLIAQPRDGGQFPYSGAVQGRRTLGFVWQYPLRGGEAVGFFVRRAGLERGRMVTLPGPDSAGLTLPFEVLNGTGVYHWQLGPLDDEGAFLDCAVSGTFALVALAREARPWPTPLGLSPGVADDAAAESATPTASSTASPTASPTVRPVVDRTPTLMP